MQKHFLLITLSAFLVIGCNGENKPSSTTPEKKKETPAETKKAEEAPKTDSKSEDKKVEPKKTESEKEEKKAEPKKEMTKKEEPAKETPKSDWGVFKGQIVFDGDAPAAEIVVKKGAGVANPAVCAVKDIASEELIVDPKSKGIANCIIWMSKKPRKIHPNLEKPATKSVKIDNKDCVFVPHVVVVRTDQVLTATNSDGCSHNVKSNFIVNKNENPILPPKNVKGFDFKFTKPEFVPMPLECNIHSWMRGYCHVVDHPYYAITDKDGNFEIKDLPEGSHTFTIWQEKAGFLERKFKAKIEGGKTVTETLKFDAKKFEE